LKRADRLFAETRIPPAAAPAWVVTYADAMTLLLCLFVAVLSMSTIRKDRFDKALGSIQATFGDRAVGGAIASDPLEQRLLGIVPRSQDGGAEFESHLESKGATLRQSGQDARLVIGGPLVFERGEVESLPSADRMLREIAPALASDSRPITIYGHSAAESPEPGSDALDSRDLAYGRAARVARLLEERGVDACRIKVVAVGDGEPLTGHAYTQKRRALNRRVEIDIVDEDGPVVSVDRLPIEKG
jgi:chemotaxis protein MotB